ncbi:Serine/arginine repetitive matrix protein 3, partial [Dissostichus eleginoides]
SSLHAITTARAECGDVVASILSVSQLKAPHDAPRLLSTQRFAYRINMTCSLCMNPPGYTEEEIRQKVSTFRQMLMDKEGVITREGSHTQPVVNHLHYEADYGQNHQLVSYEDGDYDHDYHSDNRVKRKSSSSPSPRPKKRKKKKSGRRRSRFGSSSPTHREKKKKSGKKHKRDRSASGSRKKRRYRSPGETPSRSSQRQGSCCSSRSASLSSTRSTSKSPSRLNSKHKTDGQKASSTSLSPGTNPPAVWHNGDHPQRSRNGRAGRPNHGEGDKVHDVCNLLYFAPTPPPQPPPTPPPPHPPTPTVSTTVSADEFLSCSFCVG